MAGFGSPVRLFSFWRVTLFWGGVRRNHEETTHFGGSPHFKTEPYRPFWVKETDHLLIWVWVKMNSLGTAGCSPFFHLPGFHFGFLFFDPHIAPPSIELSHLRTIPSGSSPTVCAAPGGDRRFISRPDCQKQSRNERLILLGGSQPSGSLISFLAF